MKLNKAALVAIAAALLSLTSVQADSLAHNLGTATGENNAVVSAAKEATDTSSSSSLVLAKNDAEVPQPGDEDIFHENMKRLLQTSVAGTAPLGASCGLPCATCALPTSPTALAALTCKSGLTCVYHPKGCAKRYQGVCRKNCYKCSRDKKECKARGPHCIWFQFRQLAPQCQGDGGCRLDPKYVYNPEACSRFKCSGSCDNSAGCVWQPDSKTCVNQYTVSPNGLAKEKTATCWLKGSYTYKGKSLTLSRSCPFAVAGSAVTDCAAEYESEYEYEYEYEYEEYESAGGASFGGGGCAPNPSLRKRCRHHHSRSSCDRDKKCSWTGARGHCAGDGACHAKGWCGFKCKSNCLKHARCKWSNTGCIKKSCAFVGRRLVNSEPPKGANEEEEDDLIPESDSDAEVSEDEADAVDVGETDEGGEDN